MADALSAAFSRAEELEVEKVVPVLVKEVKPESKKRRDREDGEDEGPRKREKVEGRKPRRKQKKMQIVPEDPERLARTIFIANVPIKKTHQDLKKDLKKMLSSETAKEIESVRLRSVAVEGVKTEPGASYKDVRKVRRRRRRKQRRSSRLMTSFSGYLAALTIHFHFLH